MLFRSGAKRGIEYHADEGDPGGGVTFLCEGVLLAGTQGDSCRAGGFGDEPSQYIAKDAGFWNPLRPITRGVMHMVAVR